jgi:hypothetical protein
MFNFLQHVFQDPWVFIETFNTQKKRNVWLEMGKKKSFPISNKYLILFRVNLPANWQFARPLQAKSIDSLLCRAFKVSPKSPWYFQIGHKQSESKGSIST